MMFSHQWTELTIASMPGCKMNNDWHIHEAKLIVVTDWSLMAW